MHGGLRGAGIRVAPDVARLTINGDGALTAVGGNSGGVTPHDNTSGGAGIGGNGHPAGNPGEASGTIIIEGNPTITAIGGSSANAGAGAGIGGGGGALNQNGGASGNITINGGNITASGGNGPQGNGAAIGSGGGNAIPGTQGFGTGGIFGGNVTGVGVTTHTVTWNAGGGTPAPTQNIVNYGGRIIAPATMTRTGHTFGGWFDNANFTGTEVTFPITNVTSNHQFWARWEAIGGGNGDSQGGGGNGGNQGMAMKTTVIIQVTAAKLRLTGQSGANWM